MNPGPIANLGVEVLEMKKGDARGGLATFKVRLSVQGEAFGTFPGMRLVEAGGKRFLVPRDHTHFRIKDGKDKGKVHYVHCYHLAQGVYEAILPHVLEEYARLEARGGGPAGGEGGG